MENSLKKEQILKFLNKNYFVKENLILDKYENQHWGKDIVRKLPIIFSLDTEYCDTIYSLWCYENDIEDCFNHISYKSKQLNAIWTPEMAQEIAAFQGFDAEAELTAMLSRQIATEIDAQILKDLNEITKPDELMDLVKCVGYNNLTVLDQDTFKPRKIFMSMKKQDIEYERHNNSHWQDWIRAREQDKKT